MATDRKYNLRMISLGILDFEEVTGGIVMDGLIYHVDAGDVASYSGGSTWTDLIGANNGTLFNGVGFDTVGSGGALTFDGGGQYVQGGSAINAGQDFTVEVWWRDDAPSSRGGLVASAYDYGGSGLDGWWLFAWSKHRRPKSNRLCY